MASVATYDDIGALERKIVKIYGYIDIGATGAPTINAAKSKGIKSITRNGAGDYTIELGQANPSRADYYGRVLKKHVEFVVASGVPAAPLPPHIKTDTVKTDGKVRVICGAASGASGAFVATDPASGEVMLIDLEVSNA